MNIVRRAIIVHLLCYRIQDEDGTLHSLWMLLLKTLQVFMHLLRGKKMCRVKSVCSVGVRLGIAVAIL